MPASLPDCTVPTAIVAQLIGKCAVVSNIVDVGEVW